MTFDIGRVVLQGSLFIDLYGKYNLVLKVLKI